MADSARAVGLHASPTSAPVPAQFKGFKAIVFQLTTHMVQLQPREDELLLSIEELLLDAWLVRPRRETPWIACLNQKFAIH